MVEKYGDADDNAVQIERDRFRPNWRKGRVLTKACTTTYSPIYDKGIRKKS